MASRNGDRVTALSRQLSQAHRELRRRIDDLRTGLSQDRPAGDALVTHCLAFCSALASHHEGEDVGLFAQLLRERPDMAPTVAKLVEDHGLISALLARVRQLAAASAASPVPAALAEIRRELDGLVAVMESHFAYEERALGRALDGLAPEGGWPDAVFRFGTDSRFGTDLRFGTDSPFGAAPGGAD
ncbi:hemerythrin domain-containing protein [Streptomyces sp. NPDC020917]|uniref:hemerythrin domain-containing protein n=1 Tax=Streptomyces sp. NPDC020917 TaxID=3365102 RepID=UPI0037A8A9F5